MKLSEVTITTLNIPPQGPEILPVETDDTGRSEIKWKEAIDPDGEVKGYRVYKEYDGKTELIADIKKTSYAVEPEIEFDAIYVKSVDDRGSESDPVRAYFGLAPEMSISFGPAFLYPSGSLADLADYGYGASLKFSMSNYFIKQLELNGELSFFYLPGKDDFEEPESKGDGIFLAPLLINAGYAFYPDEYFAIIPYVSAGAMFMQYSYSYFDIPTSSEKSVSKFHADPAAGAGIGFRYSFPGGVYAALSFDYRIFFEESNNFSYISAGISAGMRF
jgi:hypothetical protein